MMKKAISIIILLAFITTSIQSPSFAQFDLPVPGTMVSVSPSFEPALIRGLTVHKDNSFLFDFIVDPGQSLSGVFASHSSGVIASEAKQSLKEQANRMIKYFFAALTIPDKDIWVNLSPYEKDRMIPASLGVTAMGRDLLVQDYMLKQLTASLIYPQKALGKTFWSKVYAKAKEMYGTTQVPINTFNKVWIVPQKAGVYEHNQTAYIVNAHLKVMLEEDYLSLNKHNGVIARSPQGDEAISNRTANDTHSIASQIVKQIILPEIEKEINEGKNFATLRQIFYAQVLAVWFKRNLKQALLNQVYANKSTVKGIDQNDAATNEAIYHQYLKAYKKGVFNYIKEDKIPCSLGSSCADQTVPRKYFSGGYADLASLAIVPTEPSAADKAQASDDVDITIVAADGPKDLQASTNLWRTEQFAAEARASQKALAKEKKDREAAQKSNRQDTQLIALLFTVAALGTFIMPAIHNHAKPAHNVVAAVQRNHVQQPVQSARFFHKREQSPKERDYSVDKNLADGVRWITKIHFVSAFNTGSDPQYGEEERLDEVTSNHGSKIVSNEAVIRFYTPPKGGDKLTIRVFPESGITKLVLSSPVDHLQARLSVGPDGIAHYTLPSKISYNQIAAWRIRADRSFYVLAKPAISNAIFLVINENPPGAITHHPTIIPVNPPAHPSVWKSKISDAAMLNGLKKFVRQSLLTLFLLGVLAPNAIAQAANPLVSWMQHNVFPESGMPKSFEVPTDPGEAKIFWRKIGEDTVKGVEERVNINDGLDIYDGGVWQTVLAMAGGQENFKAADILTDTLNSGRFGESEIIRAWKPPYVYQGKKLPPGNAYFFRIIMPKYLEYDPRTLKEEIHGFPETDRIHNVEWLPVTGEDVWASIIGPLQLAYAKGNGTVDLNGPEVKLALSTVPALKALTTPIGAILYAPQGVSDRNPGDISNENNISAHAALMMLYQVTKDEQYLKMAQGIEDYFKKYAYDRETHTFYQGGIYADGTFTPSKDHLAVDVQTWGILGLSPKNIDAWFGEGEAYQIWKATKEKAGFYDGDQLIGVGYTDGHDIDTVEWSEGAIAAVNELALYYQQSHPDWSDECLEDSISMLKGQEAFKHINKDGRTSYLYSNKRYKIVFGWNANPIPSLASTGWAYLVQSGEDPFRLGGKTLWYTLPGFKATVVDIAAGKIKAPTFADNDEAANEREANQWINDPGFQDRDNGGASDAYNNLQAMGERAVPALVKALINPKTNIESRKWIIQLSSDIATKDTAPAFVWAIGEFNKNASTPQEQWIRDNLTGTYLGKLSDKFGTVDAQQPSYIKDKAMLNGGIDLSQEDAALRVEKDANGGVKVNVDPSLIARIEREGMPELDPVIINVQPADMRSLFGVGASIVAGKEEF